MIRRKSRVLILLLILILSAASTSHAIYFWGVKSLGMGTATVGIADDNNAMEINPAGCAQGQKYSIDIVYERREYEIFDYPQWHPEVIEEQDDEYWWGGGEVITAESDTLDPDEKEVLDSWRTSIVDSKTVPNFAMGLYATGMNMAAKTFEEGMGYNFGLTMAGNIADIVYLGGNAKYYLLEADRSQFNSDFGILIRGVSFIGIGLAGHNVFASDIKRRINRDMTLGVAGYILKYAQVDFDVTKDFDADADNTWNFAFGAQGIILGGLTMRGGFYWNQVDAKNLYGLGLGWTDFKYGALALAFQGDVANTRNYAINVHFNVFF